MYLKLRIEGLKNSNVKYILDLQFKLINSESI